MIPIFEQGGGKGLGHSLDSFMERFDEICAEHASSGRARAFAFILYDFQNNALKRILKDHGVFARLDRLSGTDLSVFYLHARSREAMDAFNSHFIGQLGVDGEVRLPCVIFFRVQSSGVKDVEVAELDSADIIHGFNELYEIMTKYIAAQPISQNNRSAVIKFLKASGKFIGVEAFRALLKKGFETLLKQ